MMGKGVTQRGRKRGGRNKGYFYYSGRGWFVSEDGKKVPLCYEDGQRIRNKGESSKTLDEAYHRWWQGQKEKLSHLKEDANNSITVREVVNAYLTYAKKHAAPKTYKDRCETLFDFVTGLPPRFRVGRSRKEDREAARIHPGYGNLLTCELTPLHIDQWISVHENWSKGGFRSRIQAVKRMLNYGVERKLIKENPIRGYIVPRSNPRRVYIPTRTGT